MQTVAFLFWAPLKILRTTNRWNLFRPSFARISSQKSFAEDKLYAQIFVARRMARTDRKIFSPSLLGGSPPAEYLEAPFSEKQGSRIRAVVALLETGPHEDDRLAGDTQHKDQPGIVGRQEQDGDEDGNQG